LGHPRIQNLGESRAKNSLRHVYGRKHAKEAVGILHEAFNFVKELHENRILTETILRIRQGQVRVLTRSDGPIAAKCLKEDFLIIKN
jgi:hypothetical protein